MESGSERMASAISFRSLMSWWFASHWACSADSEEGMSGVSLKTGTLGAGA